MKENNGKSSVNKTKSNVCKLQQIYNRTKKEKALNDGLSKVDRNYGLRLDK